MKFKRFIFIGLCSILLTGDFIPEDEKILNYTQVFYKWPQIPGNSNYYIYISDNEMMINATTQFIHGNSYLSSGVLEVYPT